MSEAAERAYVLQQSQLYTEYLLTRYDADDGGECAIDSIDKISGLLHHQIFGDDPVAETLPDQSHSIELSQVMSSLLSLTQSSASTTTSTQEPGISTRSG